MQLSTPAAFTQYIDVVNQAMGRHSDEMPWKLMLDASKHLPMPDRVGVALYADDPDKPHDYFTLEVKKGGKFNIAQHGKSDTDVEWRVPETHIREVINDPEPYKANPAKLNLDWLQKRLTA